MSFNQNVFQNALTCVATAVALFAAVFAWQQVDIGREHNKLSVRPILQITPYLEGTGGRNGLFLTNDGLGPALLKTFSVRSGSVVREGFGVDQWAEIIATTKANPACFGTGWPKGETAIKVGAELPLVILTKAEGNTCQLELIKLIAGPAVHITVGYESMYGEQKTLVADSRIISKTLDRIYRRLVER